MLAPSHEAPTLRAVQHRAPAFGIALVTLALVVGPMLLSDPREPPPLAGGIHVNEPNLDVYSAALHAAGLDSVQVTAYARQPVWNGPDLVWPDRDPAEVTYQVQKAHDADLSVVLVLRLHLEHGVAANRHLWHGMVWPEDLDAWFANYRAYALWGARLARDNGVEVLVLANEMNSMTSTLVPEGELAPYEYFLDAERTARVRADLVACAEQVQSAELAWSDGDRFDDFDAVLRDEEDARRAWARTVTGGGDRDAMRAVLTARSAALERHWRMLIEDVRAIYKGPVSLGANFDSFEKVGFWDAVDAIGVTSYFPLRRWKDDDPDALKAGWRRVAQGLEAAATMDDESTRPIYLLELGYTRKAGSTVRPWSYSRVEVLETIGEVGEGEAPPHTCVHWASQPEDAGERARAIGALADVVEEGGFPSLRGYSLWKLTTRNYHRRDEQFAILLPADHRDSTPEPADDELLEDAARLGRSLRGE
jgi:hypothetical protein